MEFVGASVHAARAVEGKERRDVFGPHASTHHAFECLKTLLSVGERDDLAVENGWFYVSSSEDGDPRTEAGQVVASAAHEGGSGSVDEAQGSESVPLRLEGPVVANGSRPRVASIGSSDRGGEGIEVATSILACAPLRILPTTTRARRNIFRAD
jgi:hypothetical protein